jgi:F0F1-type ATP synthase assembly protein I
MIRPQLRLLAGVLLGAVIGFVFVWVAVTFYGLLAVWSPYSIGWWKHHIRAVMIGSQLLAVIPCVVILGLLLNRLYKTRPVLSAATSMSVVILAIYADTLWTPDLVGPTIRLTWNLFLPFLIGPPLVVYLMRTVRSNSRSCDQGQ